MATKTDGFSDMLLVLLEYLKMAAKEGEEDRKLADAADELSAKSEKLQLTNEQIDAAIADAEAAVEEGKAVQTLGAVLVQLAQARASRLAAAKVRLRGRVGA